MSGETDERPRTEEAGRRAPDRSDANDRQRDARDGQRQPEHGGGGSTPPNERRREEPRGGAHDGGQERTVATDDTYTTTGEWTEPPDHPGLSFKVRNVPPTMAVNLQDRYGIKEETVKAANDGDGMEALEDLGEEQAAGFMRDMLAGNILRPRHAYWPAEGGSIPDDVAAEIERARSREDLPDAEPFDLTRLTEDDMVHLMATMMGEDPEEARARADDHRGRLEGNRRR